MKTKLTPELQLAAKQARQTLSKAISKKLAEANAKNKAKWFLGPEFIGCVNSYQRAYISCQPANGSGRTRGEKQLFSVYATEYDKDMRRAKPIYLGGDRKKAIAAFVRCANKAITFNIEAKSEVAKAMEQVKSGSLKTRVEAARVLADYGMVAA